jgi:guanyl-specific ribonuclease Sa
MSNEPPVPPQTFDRASRPTWFRVVLILGILGIVWWQNRLSQIKPVDPVANQSTPDVDRESTNDLHPSRGGSDRSESENLPDEDEPTRAEVSSSDERNSHPIGHSDSKSGRVKPAPEPHDGLRHTPTRDNRSNETRRSETNPNRPTEKSDGASYKVENQSIRDLDGKIVYKGTIDLKSTLDRIERGEANRHRNDGTSFQNREGRLPRKPSGYYKEYVHPTPGASGPGPQRIIIGKSGEVWYTPDHYKTFKEIKAEKE